MYKRHVKKLHAFMMRHLRLITKIRWQDKVTHIKVHLQHVACGYKSKEYVAADQPICRARHIANVKQMNSVQMTM